MSVHGETRTGGSAPIEPHTTIVGDYWAQIPEAMIYSDMAPMSLKIYGALIRHGRDPANCYPGNKRLAKLCHCSVPTVKRAKADLVERGWIEIVTRFDETGSQTSNGYRVHLTQIEPGGSIFGPGATGEPGGITDEPGGGITGEPGGGSQVSHKPEPLNESQMNEKSAVAPNSSQPLARAAETGDEESEQQRDRATELTDALRIIGAGSMMGPTVQELATWSKAVAKGWTPHDLLDRAEAAARKHSPRQYLLSCLTKMANTDADEPESSPASVSPTEPYADRGMSPPVPSTSESRAAEEAEYWRRIEA